jgi:hypothetical protein
MTKVNFSTKREWIDKVKLDGSKKIFDTTTPLGAKGLAVVMKAYETGDFAHVENVLTLNDVIRSDDGSNTARVVGTREVMIYDNGAGVKRKVYSEAIGDKLEAVGWKLVDVEQEDIVG